MGYGYGGAAQSIIALVASIALVSWLRGKGECKWERGLAWVAVVASLILIMSQVLSCYTCGKWKGFCPRSSLMLSPGGTTSSSPDTPSEKK